MIRSAGAIAGRPGASDGDRQRTRPALARRMARRGVTRAMARALAGAAAIVLATPAGLAFAGGGSREAPAAEDARAPVRTAKERLGGKAADEQRVDNCKVPPELRGPTPRPDDCGAPRARQR
jgi:hypothetical protein